MLMHMLDLARHNAAAQGSGGQGLHQLVLVLADGHFHEKESLRRMVMVDIFNSIRIVLHQFPGLGRIGKTLGCHLPCI